MKLLLSILFISSISLAAPQEDKLIDSSYRTERQSCTHSGYCYGYGYKYGKGYGYRYGYSSSCRGNKERRITTKTYLSSKTKEEYREQEYGSWGSCR